MPTSPDYRVPVNADIGEIDVSAIDSPDTKINSLGARGIGEIGITGTGAAVANAIFHATGKRVRDCQSHPTNSLPDPTAAAVQAELSMERSGRTPEALFGVLHPAVALSLSNPRMAW